MEYNTIRKIFAGQRTGSFFTNAEDESIPVEVMAQNARSGSRKLQSLSPSERSNVITNIADNLVKRKDEILIANRQDLEEAKIAGVTGPLYDRLAFTEGKIKSLSEGLHQIADNSFENVDLPHTQNPRVLLGLVSLGMLCLVPVHDPANKWGDEGNLGLGTCNSLSEGEEESKVAVDPMLGFQLLGSLDPLPGGAQLDQHPLLADPFLLGS